MTLARRLVRLLALGALLSAAAALAPSRAGDEGAAGSRSPAVLPDTAPLVERALLGRAPDVVGRQTALDEEALYREALALVATDRDPVVRRRLATLARQLELDVDGHAEEAIQDAHALGIGRVDAVVRRYLIELSRLALGGAVGDDVPSEDELTAFHAGHAERFTTPARVRVSHVFLSAARRGDALERDARRVLDDVRRLGLEPAAAALLGDPFVRGAQLTGSQGEIGRVLGADVAAAAFDAPLGEWLGPVRSPYGLHLLHVAERTPAALGPLDRVRGRVAHALLRERRERRQRSRMELLRERYGIAARTGAG